MNLDEGLARWLAEQWGEPVTVENLTVSSAGARRINALFDATSEHHREALAATVMPTPEIQILDVASEAAVRLLAERHGVPVPHVHGVCVDDSFTGGPFFVSSRIDGETIPRRVLRLVDEHAIGQRLGRQLGHALGSLHAIDGAEAPAALARPPGDRPIALALSTVRTNVAALLQPEPAFSYGLRWLELNQPPEPERCVIVHSDTRNGNLIVGADGLRAILDWEGAHVGDPMEDVAWPCTRMWRFGVDSLTVGGFADIADLRRGYEDAGGHWDDARFRWWRVLGTLRWGTGLAGQAAAHLDGRFRSIVMAGSGRRVSELAFDVLQLVRPG